jgi:hypothetical protein
MERSHSRGARDGHQFADAERVDDGEFARELDRLVLGFVLTSDNRDLVIAGVRAAGDANALPFEEAVSQPAGAVGAGHAVERFAIVHARCEDDFAGPQALRR